MSIKPSDKLLFHQKPAGVRGKPHNVTLIYLSPEEDELLTAENTCGKKEEE